MKYLKLISTVSMVFVVSGCLQEPRLASAYWQRVDGESSIYMAGPKAQQILEQDIARCVVEIDELVKLNALRETLPPDTHSEYSKALDMSGDLKYFDTPKKYGALNVAHSDYHDFDSCMRFKGWERVKYVPYEVDLDSRKNYKKTQYFRKTGQILDPDVIKEEEKAKELQYFKYNE